MARLVRDFNNIHTEAVIGGRECKFRSKLEYNWALYCQFRKERGLIKDWAYEQTTFRFENEKAGAVKYLVDFDILNNDGTFHYEETKAYLGSRDREKFRKVQKYYPDTVIHLIMYRISRGPKGANALRIAGKYVNRIIDASVIFRQVKGLLPLK